MPIQPYLFFNGRCQEAIDFYAEALGAETLMLMRFKESPEPGALPSGASGEMIMHASLRIGGTEIYMSDGMGNGQPEFLGFSLSLQAESDAAAKRTFTALSNGGAVMMPMSETFFASSFGMVKDKLGVPWMVIVQKTPAG